MNNLKYIGIALIVMAAFSCSNSNTNDKSATETIVEKQKTYPVEVTKIKKQPIQKTLEYTANLVAFKEIHFAPASPGRIDKIYVEVGSKVKKGQLLVETDKTQLTQALTQLENARSNYYRIDTLHQLGSISEQQYEQAKTQYELAQSNVEYLKENTTLISPINGTVTGKYFENGELYSGAPNTQAGKAAVLSLMQINPIKVMVSIPQTYFPVINKNMEVDITTDMYPDDNFKGTIYKIHPTIDQYTRTFKVEIKIENTDERLRPGMFATITINLDKIKALVVPSIAVLKQEGTNNRYIFVHKNGQAHKINVKIGRRFNDKVEIKSPEVNEGLALIIEGQANLLDGTPVNVINQ